MNHIMPFTVRAKVLPALRSALTTMSGEAKFSFVPERSHVECSVLYVHIEVLGADYFDILMNSSLSNHYLQYAEHFV